MSRPSSFPEWATGAASIIEPLTAKKQVGFVEDEEPPEHTFNWWMNLVYQWLQHLDEGGRAIAMQALLEMPPCDGESLTDVRVVRANRRGIAAANDAGDLWYIGHLTPTGVDPHEAGQTAMRKFGGSFTGSVQDVAVVAKGSFFSKNRYIVASGSTIYANQAANDSFLLEASTPPTNQVDRLYVDEVAFDVIGIMSNRDLTKTTDYGDTWAATTHSPAALLSTEVHDAIHDGTNHVLVGRGASADIVYSPDPDNNQFQVPDLSGVSLFNGSGRKSIIEGQDASGGSVLYAANGFNAIIKSSDSGLTWEQVTALTGPTYLVGFSTFRDIMIGADEQSDGRVRLQVSFDFGVTWKTTITLDNTTADPWKLASVDPNGARVVAAGVDAVRISGPLLANALLP